jgi:hypothetical protein
MVILAVALGVGGVLLVMTSRDPAQNGMTSLVDQLWRAVPRVGNTSHETWLLIQGMVLLVAAALLLVRAWLA